MKGFGVLQHASKLTGFGKSQPLSNRQASRKPDLPPFSRLPERSIPGRAKICFLSRYYCEVPLGQGELFRRASIITCNNIMIVIVPSNLPLIAEFYRTYSTDNSWPGDLVFEPSKVVSIPIPSFEELVRAIGRYAVDRNEKVFLIVSHGSGEELKMPIVTGSKFPADHNILDQLVDYASGSDRFNDSLLSNEWEVNGRKVRAFANAKQLDRVADAIRKVQGANTEQIHFRACNVGSGPVLASLADVFGSKHTSGPNSWYLFYWRATANLPTKGEIANFADRVNKMGVPCRVYTRTECLLPFDPNQSGDDPALAISTSTDGEGKPNIAQLDAVSQAAVEGWTRVFLEDSQYYPFGRKAPGNGYKRGNKLVVFGISNDGDPSNPVLFPGDGMKFLQKLEVVNRP